jgi:choice-of-anchor A domain-containing protein
VKIDWASVKAGTAIPADIVIGAGTFPSIGTFAADTNYWPVIHVTNGGAGSYSLPNQGRGMLIVDGDLTISGSNQWYGVILVGGVLTSNGNNVSQGATMSGMNALTGTTPSPSSADDAIANGTKSYVYDSCSVSKATSALARYTMMPNTWMDNLPGY